MADEKLIEAMARARAEHRIRTVRRFDTPPEELEAKLPAAVDYAWPDYVPEMRVILAAYRKHQKEAGIVEVPREPSEAIIRAVDKAAHEHWPNARKMAVGMHAVILAAAQEKDG